MLNNKDNYVTTLHFKERLHERFLVGENQALDWAREFFNQDPELMNDTKDGNQRWTNGSIVVAIDVKRRNYVTAYPVVDKVELDDEVYGEVKKAIDKVVAKREKQLVKQVADIKKNLVTNITSPEDSIESIKSVTDEISNLVHGFEAFKSNSNRLIDNVSTTKDL